MADIRRAGYEPILLEPWCPESKREIYRKKFDLEYDNIPGERPAIVQGCEDYADTLELVRKMAPKAIIAGGDLGIELTTRLAQDLGLPGNKVERLPYMCKKDMMHEALKEAGIRYIHGQVVNSVEEGLAYFHDTLKGKPAIVKPLCGGGSVGVCACHNDEMLVEALSADLQQSAKEGNNPPSVLIQEMIVGTEYYVNTVHQGEELVITNLARYDKVQHGDRRPVYIRSFQLNPLDEAYLPIIDYATKLLKAVGVTMGAVHTEIMVDEDGPVLIEVNGRLAGAHQPADWQDKVLGIHESDIAVRAFLGQDIHVSSDGRSAEDTLLPGVKAYRRISNGCYNFVHVVKPVDATEAPLLGVITKMQSYHSHKGLVVPKSYTETIDLSNVGGLIYMWHDEASVLEKEFEMLKELELHSPEKVFK